MPETNPLPPGSSGLPLIGETLAFLPDIFGFIRTRTARHGPVFRSNILGTPTAFISGPEVCDQWLDENKVQREGAFPAPIRALFGGAGILPMLDGEVHHTRKGLVLAGFTREALASYLPGLTRTVQARLSRWADGGERAITPELKLLAIEGICGNVLGLGPGPELEKLIADYRLVLRGFTGLPIPLPGTAFNAALRAKDRVLATLQEQVAEHQSRQAGENPDGLSRMLAARAPDGTALTAEQTAKELHHVVLAGVIVFAELASLLLELHRHPAVRERLAAEVEAASPSGEVTPAQLRQMPYLDQVVMEVKRTCPNVPVSFGKAKAPITLGGVTIPAGWNVMMAVGEHNHNRIFSEPAEFDPDRFSTARAEQLRSPHAFAPQGAGSLERGHKCAGYDYSTLFMQLFAVLLLRSYRWEVPQQDFSLQWGKVPPEFKTGLRVVVRKA
jgi:cytochrome P450